MRIFKGLIAVALLTLLWGAASAGAVVIKIATISPGGSAWMEMMRRGGDEVAEKTGGAVKFKFYPGGVMGDDQTVLRKIRFGQLQGGAVVSGSMAEVFPDNQVYCLPLVFDSFEQVAFVRERMGSDYHPGDRGRWVCCPRFGRGWIRLYYESESGNQCRGASASKTLGA